MATNTIKSRKNMFAIKEHSKTITLSESSYTRFTYGSAVPVTGYTRIGLGYIFVNSSSNLNPYISVDMVYASFSPSYDLCFYDTRTSGSDRSVQAHMSQFLVKDEYVEFDESVPEGRRR